MPRSLNSAKYVVLITHIKAGSNHLERLLGAAQFRGVPIMGIDSISGTARRCRNNHQHNLQYMSERDYAAACSLADSIRFSADAMSHNSHGLPHLMNPTTKAEIILD